MDGLLRRVVTVTEEVLVDAGRPVDPPLRLAAAAAVVHNPLAGIWADDLSPLIDALCEPLGSLLTARALALLESGDVEGYGKGALVGLAGEVEHGSAIIHNLRFGNRVREPVGGTSLLPAAEKRGPAGASLDLAIKHKADHSVRSHHLTWEVRIPDAPAPDEVVVWVVLATGGRPHARLAEFGSELQAAS